MKRQKKFSFNRYGIVRVIGREKGIIEREKNDSLVATSAQKGINNEGTQNAYPVNTKYNKSFAYKEEDYIWNKNIDPFASLYYSKDVIKYIEQAKEWFSMGEWYNERDIPWRRGWLLHGPGGSGKTSLAKAIAQLLGIPIYQYFLSTLSDQEFMKHYDRMVLPCMVLIEDIDNIWNKRENLTEHKSLTFDCLLNALSGVSSSNGLFVIITTNRIEYIDPALGVNCGKNGISTRPGRLDTVIELGNIDEENRYKLANRVLKDWPNIIENIVKAGDNCTPVQFNEMCLQYAFQLIADPSNTELPEFIVNKPIIITNNTDESDECD